MRLKGGPQCCKVIIKSNLLHCLWCCKSIVPVLLFVVGFLLSIRNNNRRILNVKMSSEVGNIVLGKDCQKKSKSEIPHFFLPSNFMISKCTTSKSRESLKGVFWFPISC